MTVKDFINNLQNIKNKNTQLICYDFNFALGIVDVGWYNKIVLLKTSYTCNEKEILSVRQLAGKLINLEANNNLIMLDRYGIANVINKVKETNFGYTVIVHEY